MNVIIIQCIDVKYHLTHRKVDNLYYPSTKIHFDFAFIIFLQGTIVNSSLFTMYLSGTTFMNDNKVITNKTSVY